MLLGLLTFIAFLTLNIILIRGIVVNLKETMSKSADEILFDLGVHFKL